MLFRLLFLLFCSPQASYHQIEKTITSKTQQAETQIVYRQVFAQQKSAETKRRFAKNKTLFKYDKTAFRRNETPFCKHLVVKRVQKDWIARSESTAFFLPLQGKRIVACGRLETTTA